MTQNALNNTASIFTVDNLQLDGNTIISTDANGNIILAPNGSGDIVTGTTTTANVVSMLRSAEGQWLGMNDQTDAFGVYNSTGTPEGGVAANIGSLCTDTTNGVLYMKQTDTANTGWAIIGGASGEVVQLSESTSTTSTSTVVQIPTDNSIPQITEGTSYMTHVHTPLSATNILQIEFIGWGTAGGNTNLSVALFEQPTANALIATTFAGTSHAAIGTGYLSMRKVAGGTGAITFELRFGPNAAVASGMNASGGGNSRFGAASIVSLRITEFLP